MSEPDPPVPPLPEGRVLLRLWLVADGLDPILESDTPHRPATMVGDPIELD